MNNTTNITPLGKLNLTDRFLFDEVMEDLETQQAALSIILGKDVPLLSQAESEKEFRVSPAVRSIRMDIFSMDEEGTVYNTEMQARKKPDLARRSRYYQALLDTSLLPPGIPDYNLLNDTYLITITPFDLFGYGKYQYTFVPMCREVPACSLSDGAVRIFLNTRGKNAEDVSLELIEFLNYIEHTTEEVAIQSSSRHIRRIHDRVTAVKASEEVGVKYMQAWEEKYFDREEAKQEGIREGIKEGERNFARLTQVLIQNSRTEDLLRAADDLEFRRRLYLEYGIGAEDVK